MEELTSVAEIHARQQQLQHELVKLQCTLTNFAAEGATISREGVMEARNSFGMAQFEQLVRTCQLQEFEKSGTLAGSMWRAFDYFSTLGE